MIYVIGRLDMVNSVIDERCCVWVKELSEWGKIEFHSWKINTHFSMILFSFVYTFRPTTSSSCLRKKVWTFFLSEISRLNFTPHSCLYEQHSNTPSPNLAAEDERHRGFLRLIIAPRAILLSRALELMFCVTLLAVCAQESWWVKMGRGETRRERWEIF